MTKKEYIRKLRSRLSFFVSDNDLRDIVSDMEEVFSDSMADGKSENQICTALGTPEEAARNILLERGVSFSQGGSFIKWSVFAVITVISMYFLWTYPSVGMVIMPIIPLILRLVIEKGRFTSLMEKKISVMGILSCVLPVISAFLFSKLADYVISSNDAALFPVGIAIALVTAASLVLAVLPVRTNPYLLIIGAAVTLCMVGFQIHSAVNITRTTYADLDMDIRLQQIAFRADELNVFVTTMFVAGIIIFALSALRRDKATISCMYTVLCTLMLLSREREILRTLDISAEIEPVLSYVGSSLWTEVCIMLVLSVIITICLGAGRAKNNG